MAEPLDPIALLYRWHARGGGGSDDFTLDGDTSRVLYDHERALKAQSVSRERGDPRLVDLVPPELADAYRSNATVCAVFKRAVTIGQSREAALVECVKAMLADNAELVAACVKAQRLTPNVLHFEGPPPAWLGQRPPEALEDEEIKSLLRAVLSWRAQGSDGSVGHWTTPRSRNLAQVVDRVRAEHPTLCAVLAPPGAWHVQAMDSAQLTVHLLSEGRALCGKPGPPGEWEPGHRWVHAHDDHHGPRTAANCTECLAAMPEIEP